MVAPSQRHSNIGGTSKCFQLKNEAVDLSAAAKFSPFKKGLTAFGNTKPRGKYTPSLSKLKLECNGEKTRPNQLSSMLYLGVFIFVFALVLVFKLNTGEFSAFGGKMFERKVTYFYMVFRVENGVANKDM
jgi:hypothetical protein